jgi:hypothetical protein
LLGVKYSPSSLDISYESKDDSKDPAAVAEVMGLLLGNL